MERSTTPPASWFTEPEIYQLEQAAVFTGSWLAVGRSDQVRGPGDYFSGVTAGEPYLVVRDTVGLLSPLSPLTSPHLTSLISRPGS